MKAKNQESSASEEQDSYGSEEIEAEEYGEEEYTE